jgi:asparagine synthetase B (glutamine-hydrolysing)
LLKKRGPDSFNQVKIRVENYVLLFAASVLSLRGNNDHQVTVQPIVDSETGNVLLWNGEIFDWKGVSLENQNDGLIMIQQLTKCHAAQNEIFKIFEAVKGPYAFVYFDKQSKTIYFSRDRLGRRSLLASSSQHQLLTLSSVKVKSKKDDQPIDYEELDANYLYKLELNENKSILNLKAFKWKRENEESIEYLESKETCLKKYLNLSVSSAFLNDFIKVFNENLFENETGTFFNEDVVKKFHEHLKQSVQRRVGNIPDNCKLCSHKQAESAVNKFQNQHVKCEHAKVAILYSGGVDSCVLAALADEFIPSDQPIDLLNVAFENKTQSSSREAHFLVPDRVSGIESLKELNPRRKWNFVEINITLEELRAERENLIKHLLYPHQTVLDDSIGCALWFASRGKGFLRDQQNQIHSYQSNAEILLLGMGADEQLAGYARHRTRYDKDGLKGLCLELKMEMKRISDRNLGRDDRILSDHGKESRLPYLDEDLISFLNELNIQSKCNMKLEKGFGEKYLLRYLAISNYGLTHSARLPKRAIQFGSRVAKIENMKEKGSDVCDRLIKNKPKLIQDE